MKPTNIIWALGLSLGSWTAAETASAAAPSAAYTAAVATYLEAAEAELVAIGERVNAVVPDAETPQADSGAEIETLLEAWDQLLLNWAQLSKAKPAQFDQFKRSYEAQRAMVMRALSRATAA